MGDKAKEILFLVAINSEKDTDIYGLLQDRNLDFFPVVTYFFFTSSLDYLGVWKSIHVIFPLAPLLSPLAISLFLKMLPKGQKVQREGLNPFCY